MEYQLKIKSHTCDFNNAFERAIEDVIKMN